MTLPTPLADDAPGNTNRLYAVFSIASFAIALLAVPAPAGCWFIALGWGLGGLPTASMLANFAPILLCLLGVVSGVVGLRFNRRGLAISGIAGSGILLLLMCGVITSFLFLTSLAS